MCLLFQNKCIPISSFAFSVSSHKAHKSECVCVNKPPFASTGLHQPHSCICLFNTHIKKIFLMFIYFWERERETEHEQGRGRERGRHRIRSSLQVPSCQHRAQNGAWTHEPWDHDLSWSQPLKQLSHPGSSNTHLFFKYICQSFYQVM